MEEMSVVREESECRTWASRLCSSLHQGPKLTPCMAGGKAGVPNSGVMGPFSGHSVFGGIHVCPYLYSFSGEVAKGYPTLQEFSRRPRQSAEIYWIEMALYLYP